MHYDNDPTQQYVGAVAVHPVSLLLADVKARTRLALAGPRSTAARFWEIDALRGLAVVMMVIYHFTYDLYFFQVSDAIFTNRFWFYFQRTTASLFILLVGVSLTLSHGRAVRKGRAVTYKRFLLRGLRIFAWGLLITVVTWFALGSALAIRFGILHFIGVSVMIAYPFLRYRWPNLVLGILFIGVGKVLQTQTFDLPWLVWLGFEPANHFYLDYFPLIKWFGVVLLGVFAGNMLYPENDPAVHLPDLAQLWPMRLLRRLGHHSLALYLIHQPLLFAVLVPILLLLGIGVIAL